MLKKKSKMKTNADMKANAKKSNIQEGDLVLLCQEKRSKLSSPFETSPYSVVEKKETMVLAERVSDGRTVPRSPNRGSHANSARFKCCRRASSCSL